MQPGLKLWVERDGRLVLSDLHVMLLDAVGEIGSLTGAAACHGISYRQTWRLIRDVESNLGATLVRSVKGGSGHGASRLTPLAQELIRRYQALHTRLSSEVEAAFTDAFGPDGALLDALLATRSGAIAGASARSGTAKGGGAYA
jgi:molybdate transport system regulatory protein